MVTLFTGMLHLIPLGNIISVPKPLCEELAGPNYVYYVHSYCQYVHHHAGDEAFYTVFAGNIVNGKFTPYEGLPMQYILYASDLAKTTTVVANNQLNANLPKYNIGQKVWYEGSAYQITAYEVVTGTVCIITYTLTPTEGTNRNNRTIQAVPQWDLRDEGN